jgi:hypothetical protein
VRGSCLPPRRRCWRRRPTLYSLAELTEQWRRRAGSVLGQDTRAWAEHLLAAGEPSPLIRAKDVTLEDIASVGQAVVERVQAPAAPDHASVPATSPGSSPKPQDPCPPKCAGR